MAGDITFGIRLRADGSDFVGEVRASARAIDQLGAEASGATRGTDRLAASMQRVGHYAAGLIGINYAADLVRQAVQTADAWTRVESRLKLVTGSSAEAAVVQQRLYAIAQQSRQGFTDLADVYAQVARATADTGISQQRLIAISQTLAQAVALSGGSAESARAAMVQLSQGLASGTLRGEELNSVIEQTPRLAQALAQGLGIGIGEMRNLAAEGQLTAEAVLGALEQSASQVEAEFAQLTPTVGDAFTQLGNAGGQFIDVVNDIAGATQTLAGIVSDAASGFDRFSGELRDATDAGLSFWEALKGIGLSNPWTSQAEHIARLRKEIEELQAAKSDEQDRRPITELNEEIATRQKLIDYYKRRQKAEADALISGQNLDANDRRLAATGTQLATVAGRRAKAAKAQSDEEKEAARAAEALSKALAKGYEERQAGLAGLEDEIEAERQHLGAMGLSARQADELAIIKLDLAAAAKDEEAANLAAAAAYAGELAPAYRQAAVDAERYAAKLRELAGLKRASADGEEAERDAERLKRLEEQSVEANRRAAEASAEEWNRIYDDLGRALTDAVFEGGADGWDLFKRYAQAQLIRMYVQPVIGSLVGLALNGVGLGNPSGGGGDFSLSNGYSLSSTLVAGNSAGVAYANATGSGLDGLVAATGGWGTGSGVSVSGGGLAGGGLAGAYLGYQLGDGNPAATFAGGATGIAAYGAIAGVAGGAGAAAGAAAALAAVPVWGWIALAALAIAGGMATGGTPHIGGAAFSEIGGEAGAAGAEDAPGFGLEWGAYRRGRGGDRSAAVDNAVADVINATAADLQGRAGRYGGDGAGLRVVGKFAADGEDRSQGGYAVYDGAGNVLYGNTSRYDDDPRRGFEQFGADYVRAEVAALQGLELDQWFEDILGAVDPLTDSLEVLNQALQFADEVAQQASLAEQIRALGEVDAMEAVRVAGLSATAAWFESGERIREAASAGSLSVAQMAERAGQHYANQVQLLTQIEQISRSTTSLFDDGRRAIELSVLDARGRYDYVNEEATRQLDVLRSLTDADEINRYAQLISQNISQAYGLLSPDQQADYAAEFIGRYDQLEQVVQQQLDGLRGSVLDEQQSLAIDLSAQAEAAIDRTVAAGVELIQAARDALPRSIDVNVRVSNPTPTPVSAEVGFITGDN